MKSDKIKRKKPIFAHIPKDFIVKLLNFFLRNTLLINFLE